LMAHDIGAGDEVITTPYSFFATAGSIARLGARPVFVDIESDSFNLDPHQLRDAITPRTRAILPVHLFGRSADMGAIGAIAADAGIPVIEDAAQSIGATLDGRRAGGIGTSGCFSFFPAKNLGCFGDGGLVTTDDEALAERFRRIRNHGGARKYFHSEVGGNFRLDTLQAAVLRVKLPALEGWTSEREANAARYEALFEAHGLRDRVTLPKPGPGRHVWNQYVIRVPAERRDPVVEGLRSASIGCAVYYPRPLHLQPCFEDLGFGPGAMPEAERAARETVAIPVAPGVTAAHQEEVISTLGRLLG